MAEPAAIFDPLDWVARFRAAGGKIDRAGRIRRPIGSTLDPATLPHPQCERVRMYLRLAPAHKAALRKALSVDSSRSFRPPHF